MKHQKTFTLIEMMVVIAVIAILLSLLSPALGRARRTSLTAVCASNQQQIGLGLHMWSQDNLNHIPAGQATNNLNDLYGNSVPSLRKLGKNEFNAWTGETGTMPNGEWSSVLGYANSQSSNYVSREVLLDPAVGSMTKQGNGSQYTHYSFTSTTNTRYVKTTHLSDPSNFLYLSDGTEKATAPTNSHLAHYHLGAMKTKDVLYNGDPNKRDGVAFIPNKEDTTQGTVDFRHLNKSNVLFADGHVKGHRISDITRSMFRPTP